MSGDVDACEGFGGSCGNVGLDQGGRCADRVDRDKTGLSGRAGRTHIIELTPERRDQRDPPGGLPLYLGDQRLSPRGDGWAGTKEAGTSLIISYDLRARRLRGQQRSVTSVRNDNRVVRQDRMMPIVVKSALRSRIMDRHISSPAPDSRSQ